MVSVSIIIPCYNQGEFLPQAIESLQRQGVDSLDIIVINDGSTDDTSLIAKNYEPHVRLFEQQNRGLPHARNRGLAESRGDYVMFLDADDMLAPGTIRAFVQQSRANPEAKVFYGGCDYIDSKGELIKRLAAPTASTDTFHWLLRRNRFPCHSVFVRRDVFQITGGFCEILQAHEDWDLWLRIAASGIDFHRVEGASAMYRRYPETMSKCASRMKSTGLEVLRRNSGVHPSCRRCQTILREATFDFSILPYFRSLADQKMSAGWVASGFLECLKKEPALFPAMLYYSAVYGMRYLRGGGLRE